MDKKTLELWQQGLAEVAPQVSPEYAAVNRRLLGYLAASGSTFNDLKAETRNQRNNVDFLKRFSMLFPDLPYSNNHLTAPDEVALRNIMTNVVWLPSDPFLVVGEREGDNGTELLALGFPRPARVYNESNRWPRCGGTLGILNNKMSFLSRVVRSNNDELKSATRQLDQLRGSEYPSPAEIKNLYKSSYGPEGVRIKIDTPNATVIQKAIFTEVRAISDEMLGAFDVLSKLTQIASQFGLTDQLAKLIEDFKAQVN